MTLKNVLEEICAEEYALPANAPAHRFKRRHRRAMNAVLYPNGLPKTERKLTLRRRLLVIAVVAVLAVVTGAAASFYHFNGFKFYKGKDKYVGEYYIMLVENRENAPKIVEKMIYDDNVPEDFMLDGIYKGEGSVDEGRFVSTQYISRSPERINKFGKQGAYITIEQVTKSFFVNPIQGQVVVNPVEVRGGCKGFTMEDEYCSGVIWDSGDYIHTVFSTLSIEDTLVIVEDMTEK